MTALSIHVPAGFRVAGVHCGIKANPRKEDLTLIAADADSVAAGVYTQNIVCAAPVRLNRTKTPSSSIRAVVINSGNANACTGSRGDQDARQMASWGADACGARPEQVLVLSTGLIGEALPMERIQQGIRTAAGRLAAHDEALFSAARGMMTTDTAPKLTGQLLSLEAGRVQVTGMAKGAAMIGPNMATMLAVILSDAALHPQAAQEVLASAVDESFNAISVEGHTSTNDSVLLLASGASSQSPLAGESLGVFRAAVLTICQHLARAIVDDGEGVSHRITIEVQGCASRHDARQIAKTIANSVLVKTAIAGGDPNWGRILSAAGYAGVPFDPAGVGLFLNGYLLYDRGAPVAFDRVEVSRTIRDSRETHVLVTLCEGTSATRFWTSDLTTEYIRQNVELHT